MPALVNKSTLSWFMLITIFVTFQMIDGMEAINIAPKVEIGMTNTLRDLQLRFHCKDRTRDNGFHTLASGETYYFGFKIDIFFESTQWFCLFTWKGESHHFDIYVQTRDDCTNCNWIIGQSGPCKLLDDDDKNEKCYPWNDKEQHEFQGRKRFLISNTTTQQEPPLSCSSTT
ncbi:unnamed protein product [Lupinus luteus]|uniref:S-protein homolog n=1 Tax=Lupinus luteus TaxID=3873 RepID=A0AAV1X6B6_LUPLU